MKEKLIKELKVKKIRTIIFALLTSSFFPAIVFIRDKISISKMLQSPIDYMFLSIITFAIIILVYAFYSWMLNIPRTERKLEIETRLEEAKKIFAYDEKLEVYYIGDTDFIEKEIITCESIQYYAALRGSVIELEVRDKFGNLFLKLKISPRDFARKFSVEKY